MLGYPGLAVVGVLGSDGVSLDWLLLIMFVSLPLAIWLSLVLSGLVVPRSRSTLRLFFPGDSRVWGMGVTPDCCEWENCSQEAGRAVSRGVECRPEIADRSVNWKLGIRKKESDLMPAGLPGAQQAWDWAVSVLPGCLGVGMGLAGRRQSCGLRNGVQILDCS